MTLYQLWDPTVQFQSRSGKNLVNGQVKVTYADRVTAAPVYDAAGTVIQNPVILDENGRAACYGEVGLHYTLCVYAADGSLLYTQSVQPFPYDTEIVQKTTQLTSNDGSVALTESSVGYDLAVAEGIQAAVAQNTSDIADTKAALETETAARVSGDASARTELVAGKNVSLQKTTGSSGQDIYTVSSVGGSGSSNICVIQYGSSSKTLADLQQYDTVLMQMNSKTFYMTELTDSTAHFMSCYQINGKDCIETCDYDGSAWTDVSTAFMDSNVLVVSEVDTLSYDTLSKYDAVFLKKDAQLAAVMTYLDTSRAIFTSFTTRYRGTLMATDIPTLTYTFSTSAWTTSYVVADYTLCIVPYGSSTVTFNDVMAFVGAGGTCALQVAQFQFAYMTNSLFASTAYLEWTRNIDGKVETYRLTNDNEWSMTSTELQPKLTAGDGITIDGDVISSQGKVASQEGHSPDYLGNVLKAGQNITITKDGAQVRIDSAGSSSDVVAGYYTILYSNSSPSVSNIYSLSSSALMFDYLLIDWVDVDGNARRDQVNISELKNIASSSKAALSSNNFTVFVPDSSVGFGWFKWFRWYLPDISGLTLYHSGGEYSMSSTGEISSQSTWSGTSTTSNSPKVYKIVGVIQQLEAKSFDLNSSVYVDITDSEVV